ncbi:M28 family peptidase [Bacillus sp. FJAT-47783]|uniref:M28 family peptidase n=1 Tax=Bacillus sp. FJAT-47783 TaxID=2922712 RepID=UPI001FAC6436|nr:M28 family peptidase [Bacillus sp. FJAT-47783]
MRRKAFASLLVAASISLGVSAVSAEPLQAQNVHSNHAFDNKIIKRISADKIYHHIATLSEQPRVAGTESEWKAVQYIKNEFESYGYHTELQPFTFMSYEEPTNVSLTVNGNRIETDPFTYTPNGNVTGELVFVGLGSVEDVQGKDLSGKIALIKRGSFSFAEKVLNAANAGAEAVIIFNHIDGELHGTLGGANDDFVPVVSITKQEGEALVSQLSSGQAFTASVTVEGANVSAKTSHNVIATKKATHKKKDTNQMVIVGAHHDSVDGAPGANDDASGTAATLELARVMANMPTDTELRFVTFGAEELGLIGSYEYVDSLTEDEINRTVGMFQMDMVGSRDAGDLVMFTVDGEKNIVTDLAASAGVRTGTPLTYGQEGRSDHVPFYYAGIPAALFIHSPVEPWYHSPEDTLDKISKEKLQETAEIVGASVYQIARPDTPALERANVAPKEVEYEKYSGGLQ